ncbi:hypothetical protein ACT453_42915, partial [Bacillus sp. D-CC]
SCEYGNLEQAQTELAEQVATSLQNGFTAGSIAISGILILRSNRFNRYFYPHREYISSLQRK